MVIFHSYVSLPEGIPPYPLVDISSDDDKPEEFAWKPRHPRVRLVLSPFVVYHLVV